MFECASSVECPGDISGVGSCTPFAALAVVSVMSPYRRSKRITGAASPHVRLVMLAAVAMAATALFARAAALTISERPLTSER